MLKNFVWSFFQQGAGQVINLIITIFLARLITPNEFGLMALTYVFYTIAERLMESGMGESFIRTKDAQPIDFNTIFFTTFILSIFFYIIIFIVSPYVASYYNQPLLTSIIRVNSLSIIMLALNITQTHHLWRELKLKETTIIFISSSLLGGLIGILAAYHNFGVWSLVIVNLSTGLIRLVLTLYYSIWQPSFMFSFEILKKHLNFGIKLTITNLIDAFFKNIYVLIIGKKFDTKIVGHFNRAESTKNTLSILTYVSVYKVMFPHFSKINHKQEYEIKILELFNMVFYFVNYFIFFIILITLPLFNIVFSKVWQIAAGYFQILCFTTIFYAIYSLNTDLLKISGHAGVVLKTELLRKSIELIAVLVALYFSIDLLLYVLIIISLLNFLINSYFVEKHLNISQSKQVKNFVPILFTGLVSYFFSKFILSKFICNDIQYVLFAFIIFTISFILLSIMLELKPYILTVKVLKTIKSKHK